MFRRAVSEYHSGIIYATVALKINWGEEYGWSATDVRAVMYTVPGLEVLYGVLFL